MCVEPVQERHVKLGIATKRVTNMINEVHHTTYVGLYML